ncbi:MAG: hypothetical protein A3D35_00320 [Candidatus Staskawiczbacteria bacterium RIFCSPHIGHO2_02_FULL_34_9]|uniref:Uncharacterized protein n=1 Tax=Candidatus Staskawiczbacteria bacterium RIFCSPHIGHO2_02_FULL_34_9 TaxID=1802206 RepID=A0A1G2I584_9BACT|nr:MAG: hypothetical protein A3D35_00320 [Candidatus Staskawiczbacteria bacterium RIFCSPHIGHO2_02_FULL_34_9]
MPTTKLVINEVRTRTLSAAGFVHVTGLMTYNGHGSSLRTIQPNRQQLGRCDRNNGTMVLVTEDGEVWLRDSSISSMEVDDTIDLYAPNGSGAYVPCSNGESLGTHAMLERIVDPFDNRSGNPVPEIQD